MTKSSKYGEAAIKATKFYRMDGETTSPRCAWEKAVKEVFPNRKTSQSKSCPRDAYVGLCQEGLVRDIPARDYTASIKSKSYAICAVDILKLKPHLTQNTGVLWREVLKRQAEDLEKTHNQQMDVVVALWLNDGFTCCPKVESS